MTVRRWIKDHEIRGLSSFSVEMIRTFFVGMSEQLLSNELFRLSSQKVIVPVYRGFYVIMPPHYAAKGIVPPIYYIDQLMHYLRKPYYISLLSAAELLGAAHQRPQKFSVTTIFPKSTVSVSKNNLLIWNYRKEVSPDLLLSKNSETGVVYYSNAELTAVDLIQYEQYIGGLSRAATVLEELTEQMNFSKDMEKLFTITSVATIQRLGYILDEVLGEEELADALHIQLKTHAKAFRYIPLSTRCKGADPAKKNARWKIHINLLVQPDDI